MRQTNIGAQEKEKEHPSLHNGTEYTDTSNEIDTGADPINEMKVVNGQTAVKPNMNIVNQALTGRTSKRLIEPTEDIAFHVYLTANRCYNDHQVIEYDGEELDLGSGYNKHDGIYVVPLSGVYVFTWTFLADYSEYAVTEIVLNGVRKGWTVTDGSNQRLLLSPSSSLVVLNVSAGDHVFIRRAAGRGCTARSGNNARTTFSGWRLFP